MFKLLAPIALCAVSLAATPSFASGVQSKAKAAKPRPVSKRGPKARVRGNLRGAEGRPKNPDGTLSERAASQKIDQYLRAHPGTVDVSRKFRVAFLGTGEVREFIASNERVPPGLPGYLEGERVQGTINMKTGAITHKKVSPPTIRETRELLWSERPGRWP